MRLQHWMRRLCVAPNPWIWYIRDTRFVSDALFGIIFTKFLLLSLGLGFLGDVVQVSTQHLNALNVVTLVKLLVDGVGTVCGASHGQQQDVLAGSLLESKSDGDTIETFH